MFTKLLSLSVLYLLRARTRMLMTMGGILIATTGIILLIAFALGLQDAAESGLGSNGALTQIVVSPSGQSGDLNHELTLASVQKLSRLPGVKAAVPMVSLLSNQVIAGVNNSSLTILGVDPAQLTYLDIPVQSGTLTLASGEALAGSEAGNNFQFLSLKTHRYESATVDLLTARVKLKITQTSTAPPASREFPLKVTGQLQSGTDYDSDVLIPISDAISMNMWMTGGKYDPKKFVYDLVVVRSENRELTNSVARTIETQFGFSTKSLGTVLDQMNSFFSVLHLVLGGIGMIILLVAAAGVANTMLMATREQTKEIGLMKAIGGTDEDILTIFLLEAGLIGLVGSLGGVGVSLLLQDVINRGIQNLAGSQNLPSFLPSGLTSLTAAIIIPPDLALLAVALAIVVSIGAGLYPALWAARLQPVIALKHE